MRDKQLIKIARDFRRGMIGKNTAGGGFCGMICWPLSSMLSGIYGVKNECASADLDDEKSDWANHVWIKLADGRVIDPTFDQFCSEEPVDVYLGPPTEFHIEQATP